MGPPSRYLCTLCKREYVKDFLVKDQGEYICCMFCEIYSKVCTKIDNLGTILDTLQIRVGELEDTGQDACVLLEKETDVTES